MQDAWYYPIIAFGVFIIASLTDYWDGLVARKRGELSNFGRLMDPIADKVLVLSCFFVFLSLKLIALWMVLAIVLRELLITGMRLIAMTRSVILSADRGGKNKLISQVVTICVIFTYLTVRSLDTHFSLALLNPFEGFFRVAIFSTMLITVLLTILSGLMHIQKNWRLICDAKPRKNNS